jgi:hypothetical protein
MAKVHPPSVRKDPPRCRQCGQVIAGRDQWASVCVTSAGSIFVCPPCRAKGAVRPAKTDDAGPVWSNLDTSDAR